MNYCGLKTHDIADGPGVRVGLFVSGCRHHCDGCFQPESWAFGYGRAQVHKDSMMREMVEQMAFYSGMIEEHSGWEYAGVFIDSGSGRSKLNALLEDCRCGRIDLVITASIDTLGMDKMEMLNTLGDLREMNVDMYFQKEDVRLLSEDGETLISVLALYVHPPREEPKEEGDIYGLADEEEAANVRKVFDLFFSGLGRIPIANAMNQTGALSPKGKAWTYCDVRRIMAEEAYKDTLIDAETWEKAKHEEARRSRACGYRRKGNHRFTGLITCGVCGSTFTRRERGTSSLWLCRTYLVKGRAVCPSKGIREKILTDIIGEVENLDNITVYPDGRLFFSANDTDYERRWR